MRGIRDHQAELEWFLQSGRTLPTHETSPPLRRITLGLCLALTGCLSPLQPDQFAAETPEMRPDLFFLGSTRSTGILENRNGAPSERFRVEGVGTLLPDGRLQLDQTVAFEQQPVTTRRWLLTATGPNHYRASLTGASGPVEAEAYGNLFHLRYPMEHPFGGRMEQWLYLQPDGHTLVNEATVTLFGLVVVAHLSERITND